MSSTIVFERGSGAARSALTAKVRTVAVQVVSGTIVASVYLAVGALLWLCANVMNEHIATTPILATVTPTGFGFALYVGAFAIWLALLPSIADVMTTEHARLTAVWKRATLEGDTSNGR
jgi:hypothetical protein